MLKNLQEQRPELDLNRIDLLKLDVEGDEENVLEGLDDPTWGKIQQIIAEVHDVDGRLQRILGLLKRHGFFEVRVKQQQSEETDGYFSFVPKSLGLHMIYASRTSSKRKHDRESDPWARCCRRRMKSF
eukprot:gnl/MRDRNA2_/MRDRNA2_27671_c0_seq1.p1 gnl/MRDRNA2_/MRDRNA2_27671_c0~~gnl/MRDRNA2_/MRDRNA2_27671_c0_seq1.p1  ORF type:complete len:128 (+),score=19.80 gnl/MRDRNA2_/MRDRNA2_27671_c0_seq1:88-471(+)